MRRLPLLAVAAVVLVALGLLSSLVTRGFQDLAEAEAERDRLSERRGELERRIAASQAMLDALESDPGAVESVARHDLGWIGPDETVVVIATPTPVALAVPSGDPASVPLLRLR